MGSPKPVLYHSISLPFLTVPGNVWLAPMAGYTDAAFRSICVRHGASLCFTEMVSADALARNKATTLRLLRKASDEALTGFQIFASGPAMAGAAVRRIASLAPSIIDLNCGCSVRKVLKANCGAVLLRNPALIGSIVAAMKGETDLPLSVKLRLGWDSASLSYMACAEAAIKAGASLVTLHPRTGAQGFSGTAQWEHIRALKKAVAVAVIGSGDLFTAAQCAGMIEATGCDGVMLARGCLGNPFLFSQTVELLRGCEGGARLDASGRLSTAMQQLLMLAREVGEPKACRDMRKHFVAYTKGLEGGAALRRSVVQAESVGEYQQIVASYLRE